MRALADVVACDLSRGADMTCMLGRAEWLGVIAGGRADVCRAVLVRHVPRYPMGVSVVA